MSDFMVKGVQRASWLTERRVRFHGLVLGLCLWSVYAWNMSAPGLRDRNGLIKGTDFLHFYTLGTLARQGRGELLYDIRNQAEVIRKLLPETAETFYVPLYGPQVSLLFAPFARLSYGWGLLIWLLLNTAIYAACCHAVWKICPNLRRHGWTVLILAIAFPGFFHLLAWGQTSGLALGLFTLAYFALRTDRQFLAGLAIGSLIFKPQLGLAAAIVLIVALNWRLVLGAVAGAVAQLAIAWAHYGTEVMRHYMHALLHVGDVLPWLEPRPYQMHSLRAFWSLLLPWPLVAFVLYLASALVVLALTVRCWKSGLALELRYTALLLATVLVSPHLTVYDLVILAPAFLWLGDWAVANCGVVADWTRIFLYASYPLFLLGPVARVTHVQLSVAVLAGLLWAIQPRKFSVFSAPLCGESSGPEKK